MRKPTRLQTPRKAASRRGAARRPGPRHLRRLAAILLTSGSLLLAGLALPATMPLASAASCGSTNLAAGQPATASSAESASFPASAAVDGNTGTRWSSAFADPQWLQVDLGSSQTICQVTLNWEAAYATTGAATPDGTAAAETANAATGSGAITITNPRGMESRHGAAVSLQIRGSAGLAYSATGLPAGLAISGSGLISGTGRSAGTRTVTVTGKSAAGVFTTITFIWTVA